MKISLNVIKKYLDFDLPPVSELVTKINQQLGSVEEIIDLGARYKDAVIVKIIECSDHENADRLHVCKVDDGGVVQDIQRDDSGYVQVVCGAPNAKAGIFVVWLPPGSTVPASFSEAEPFVLGSRELRGVTSHGMLASPKELGLGDYHEGILEIDEDAVTISDDSVRVGASFAKTFGLNDTIIDIENKMFTHRPDLFGQIGVAREIAGILGRKFPYKERYLEAPELATGDGLELEVFNDATNKVPRFMALALKNIQVKPSPLWLQCELVRLGAKPINNIVDATNHAMLTLAQPTHAYDYDKLRGHKLGVRMAQGYEEVELLNHKTYKLKSDDIVIVDGDGPIGLAGIMGGYDSEVTAETKNIVLEVATFDMYAVRKSSMRHGVFTDALTRFNKGQSPLQNDRVLNDLSLSIQLFSPGSKPASQVFDCANVDALTPKSAVEVSPGFINERLGLVLKSDEIKTLLENVEFSVAYGSDNKILVVQPPFWRMDISLPEDIVEEVGRLYGYEKLPRELPRRSAKPTPLNPEIIVKQKIRESLSRAGANEVLTYSFTPGNVMQKAGQDADQAFKLSNALSPDLQYYRLSVLPSLLDKVHANIKSGYDEFVLFEIGKGHNKKYHADDDAGLPSELDFVDYVYASKRPKPGAAYYKARKVLETLSSDIGTDLVFKPIAKPFDFSVTAPFDQSRSALVETSGGVFIGMVGELKQSVIKGFKLPKYCAAATLDFSGLLAASQQASSRYKPLSKYPSVSQDISLKLPASTAQAELYNLVRLALDSVLPESASCVLKPTAIYMAKQDDDTKTITYRLVLTRKEKTMTDAEVNKILDKLAEQTKEIGTTRQ